MTDPPCLWCGQTSTLLCDGKVFDTAIQDWGTCDAPVCSSCAATASSFSGIVCKRGGKGRGCERVTASIDYCPFCAGRGGKTARPLQREVHDRDRASHIRDSRPAKIGVVTGGRKHFPTLAELERLTREIEHHGITAIREGEATGVDKIVRGYISARSICQVEKWPADWTTHKRAAGPIRNRAMLDGDPPDLLGQRDRQPADMLFAFKGNNGTADCRAAAIQRGIQIGDIAPAWEPRIWNMHHKWTDDQPIPPGLLYVGRSSEHGGPSPLANPHRLDMLPGEDRATAAVRILGMYREWLWSRMQAGDADVLGTLDAITPDTWLGCTCWPAHCHAEIIVRAWRYRRNRS